MSFVWTPEAVEQMLLGRQRGRTAAQIAEILGCTKAAVVKKSQRERVKRPEFNAGRGTAEWTPELVEALRAGLARGESCGVIANRLGVSRNAVIGKSHRLGIGNAKPTITRAPTPKPPAYQEAVIFCEPVTTGIPVWTLAPDCCRYPVASGGMHLFCTAPKERGSFCAGHARLAYREAA